MRESPPFQYLAISDRNVCPEPVPDRCNRLTQLGVPALQIRHKKTTDRQRWSCLDEIDKSNNTALLINGRFDLALLGNLDGVHLPASGLPPAVVKEVVGGSMIIGRSTHTITEVREAKQSELDYVLFGPVFPTPSKPDRDSDEIPGLRGLERAVKVASVPVLALGGVTPDRVTDCLDAGADGVAGIRALFGPEDPRKNWTKIQENLRSE